MVISWKNLSVFFTAVLRRFSYLLYIDNYTFSTAGMNNNKKDKAKYVESHLFEFKLADPVDAAPDGTAGHTAHRPLSPAVRLTSYCKYTATSL